MGSQPKLQREHNEAQQEATEATELQGTSQWLRVPVIASSSLSHSSHHPISVIAAVKKFWRRQVIATIPENECQDHFGTETPSFILHPTCLRLHITRIFLTFTVIFSESLFILEARSPASRSVHAHRRFLSLTGYLIGCNTRLISPF